MLQFVRTILDFPAAVREVIRQIRVGRYVEKVLLAVKLPSRRLDRETWCVIGELKNARRVCLDITVVDDQLMCVASTDLTIDEPFVLQRFGVLVLKENCRYQIGANRLLSSPEGLKLVHSHCCDPARYRPREVAAICLLLMRQMQALMELLKEEDLIISVDPPTRQKQ